MNPDHRTSGCQLLVLGLSLHNRAGALGHRTATGSITEYDSGNPGSIRTPHDENIMQLKPKSCVTTQQQEENTSKVRNLIISVSNCRWIEQGYTSKAVD
jgi:hypothetical protein